MANIERNGKPTATSRRPEGRAARDLVALGALVVAAALLWAVAGAARAATYKWVDDKGEVHYSDKMPPDAVGKANVELNKQGIAVKKTDAAPTPEQLRAKAQEEERQRVLAKQNEEMARRDRALVASYTSEAEIDLARKRAVQTIDNVIQSSQAFIEQLNKRKAEAEAKRNDAKTTSIGAALDRELEGIDAELARQDELIGQKKREMTAVAARYDADKQRWRELVAAKAVANGGSPAAVSGTVVAPTKSTTAGTGSSAAAPPKK